MPDNSWKDVLALLTNQKGYIHAIINLVFPSDRKINLWYIVIIENTTLLIIYYVYTSLASKYFVSAFLGEG